MNIFLLYAGTVLIWGSTWLVIKYQLGLVAPEVSVTYRFALAAAILLVYCFATSKRMRYGLRDHLGMAALGLFLFSANYFVFYLATYDLTTGLIAVVFSGIVVTNIIFGALFLGNPIRPRVALGAAFGIAGLALVFLPEILTFDLANKGSRGLLLSVAGTLLASVGNMASASNQRRGLPVVQANAYGMTYGTIFMFAFALIGGSHFNFDSAPLYVGSLLYLAVFGSVFGFGCYLTLIGRIGPDKAAYATVLFPLIALALSTVFEGYQWSGEAIVGMVLVLFGNVLVLSRKRSQITVEASA
ncbi:MAG: DMT family transporter [Rhodospirillaceae bacterium]|nr:DMT family transporter [Rhodospirillaceae bacterium]MBL6941139.1 DMT family transporter [Rhodospirillales bacterium]